EAIIHQATALGGTLSVAQFDKLFAVTDRLRTEGTQHLLAAAAEFGIGKVIAQSYCGWPYAKFGPPAAAETHPFDAALPPKQRSASYALQYQEAALREAAVEGVALRYGGFYGP